MEQDAGRQEEPPSEEDVEYPGGAPALRRDEFLQGRLPVGKESAQESTQLSEQEAAEIVRTVARQSELFKRLEGREGVARAQEVSEASDQFLADARTHGAGGQAYAALIACLLGALRTTADVLGMDAKQEIEAMQAGLGAGSAALNEAHRSYLSKLNSLL